jgi:choloylglycine hydrolase
LYGANQAAACTGVILRPADGGTIVARTLEFGADLVSFRLIVVPRKFSYAGQTTSGQSGLKWTTRFGHVGFAPFDMPLVADGVNERGLGCGAFYLPGYAEYQSNNEQEIDRTLSQLDLVSWVLGSFETVAQVREALTQVRVVGVVPPQASFVVPLHYWVVDETGDAAVIEYTGGELHLFEAPLRVITNSPTYDWHMTNARNYLGLQALNRPGLKLGNHVFSQFGQGSGAIGLPGDFTPPSRFIRAAFLAQTVYPGKTAPEGIAAAFHILNQFDIPRGAVREREGDKVMVEATQWTSASDLRNRRYYFHTEHNRTVQRVNLDQIDLNADQIKSLSVDGPGACEDLSARLQ